MKRHFASALMATTLAACGGGGGTASAPVAVVPAAPTPTPTPAPAPTPTPTPTPTATPLAYARFADLTGDQRFQTSCAALTLMGEPSTALPATPFGDGFTLSYTAATGGYTVAGDGLNLGFAATDRDAGVALPARAYAQSGSGYARTLLLSTPTAAGGTLEYGQAFALHAQGNGSDLIYQCVFGVPTLLTDAPTRSTFSFARAGIGGSAYITVGGITRAYALDSSTATLGLDLTRGEVTVTIHLLGTSQDTGSGAAPVELGTYRSTATIDGVKGSYYGQLVSTDRTTESSHLGGWFFGPQIREGAYSFDIVATDPASGARIAAVGTGVAIQN